jgi:hypothetical protein
MVGEGARGWCKWWVLLRMGVVADDGVMEGLIVVGLPWMGRGGNKFGTVGVRHAAAYLFSWTGGRCAGGAN